MQTLLISFIDVPQLKGFAQDVHVQQAFLRQFRAGFNPLPGNQIDVKYRYNLLRNLYLHLLTVLFLYRYVIFQKRLRVFHWGFQTRENYLFYCFSSVWKP